MDEKDNVKWLERSTRGAPRYIILLYIVGIAIIGILIFVGFHIIGKDHVNTGHEIFRDILTIVLTIAGITAGIMGYGIYRKVSEHIESTMKKKIDEFTDYSYALYYLTAGHSYWLREEESYLFSWDDVPGNDSERLLRFLRADWGIGWEENTGIHKSIDGKTIYIFKDKNLPEITIDVGEGKATFKISDSRIHDLKVKKENGKLNIYEETKPDLFNLDNAISKTLEAYEHVCQLDKSEERNIIVKYKILNNLGYFYAALGKEEDRTLALNCATRIENRIKNTDSFKESAYLQDTYNYIMDKYPPVP